MQEIKLINFINLNKKEIQMVYQWRNDKNIRKWMFNNKPISLDNHNNFINNLKSFKLENVKYFLVLENLNYLGVITFKNINLNLKQCDIGLYANPDKQKVGKILLNQSINYGFKVIAMDKLIIKVFTINEKAINLYKKMNFKEVSKKTYQKKELIYMELKKISQ